MELVIFGYIRTDLDFIVCDDYGLHSFSTYRSKLGGGI